MATLGRIKPRNFDTSGDYVANSMNIAGNVSAGNIKTNNLLYANGTAYVFTTNAAGSNTQIQFNNANSFAGSANLTFNNTTNTLSVTNIAVTDITTTGVANLGTVANIKIAGGSNTQLLTTDGNGNLSWTSVSLTGYATETYVGNAIANLVNSAPETLNTLSELSNALANDASYSTTITNALANKLSTTDFISTANNWGANYLPNFAGNISANFFIGNGSQLTGLPASYTDSNVASYLANYTGNIGTLTSLNVNGNVSFTGANVSLGNVSNLKISGGTANFILATDGSGNLVWTAKDAVGVAVTLDTFTGNGVATNFTLSRAPIDENHIVVNIDGVIQLKTAYSVSGTTLTFTSAPDNNTPIEVQIIAFVGASAVVNFWSYTGTGAQTAFAVSSTATANNVLVTENGILQMPTVDYTVSSNNVNFVTAPASNVAIQIREIPSVTTSTAPQAQTVTNNAQPNITSVGTLTSLSVTGNVTANNFIGNGSQLTGISAGVSNARVVGYNLVFGG